MLRIFILYLISVCHTLEVYGTPFHQSQPLYHSISIQEDSLQKLQSLYRGVIWTNKYRRYEGDQFFLTSRFIPGTVTVDGHTYKNLRLKYDILSDEIITPLNMDEIIQLNKEIIDSFSLSVENRIYRFINMQNDSTALLNGYCNLIYNGRSCLYVKYVKKATTAVTPQSDGEFNQSSRIFVVYRDVAFQVKNSRDLLEIFSDHKEEIKQFISEKRLKLSKNDPWSFIPVMEYYDSIDLQKHLN